MRKDTMRIEELGLYKVICSKTSDLVVLEVSDKFHHELHVVNYIKHLVVSDFIFMSLRGKKER